MLQNRDAILIKHPFPLQKSSLQDHKHFLGLIWEHVYVSWDCKDMPLTSVCTIGVHFRFYCSKDFFGQKWYRSLGWWVLHVFLKKTLLNRKQFYCWFQRNNPRWRRYIKSLSLQLENFTLDDSQNDKKKMKRRSQFQIHFPSTIFYG